MKKPMTVAELYNLLSDKPNEAVVAWVDKEGNTGYFYADEQADSDVDNGHVHLELGDCDGKEVVLKESADEAG